ncbi:MAG: nucleotidyltransferase family protein [Draconibacterium sp.]
MNTIDQYISLLTEFKNQRGYLYGINRIGIFGSVAKGNQTENSDIDIYYEGKALSLFKIAALKEELENLLNTTVDIIRVRDSMNGLLKRNIKKDGIYV